MNKNAVNSSAVTWYFVLYLGWSLAFISRSWSIHPFLREGLIPLQFWVHDPCTNASP
jgi:hypothetical protein